MSETISACIIVKDGAETILRALESVKDQVDEIIIHIDTDTTDNTMEVVSEWGGSVCGDRHPYVMWQSYLFDGFGDARNLVAQEATGNWILILDADEELAPGCDLHELIDEDHDIVSFRVTSPVGNGGSVQPVSYRLYRKGKARYKRRVHNTLNFDGDCRFRTSEATIIHTGYALSPEQMKAKYKRTEDLLGLQMQDDILDRDSLAYDYMCLVQTYRNQNRWRDVISAYHAAFDILDTSDLVEQHTMCDAMIAYMELKDHERAIGVGLELLEKYPDNLDANYHLGMAYFHIQEWSLAANYLSFYLVLVPEVTAPGFVSNLVLLSGKSEGAAWNNIALCALKMGNATAALFAFKKAEEMATDRQTAANFRNMLLKYICTTEPVEQVESEQAEIDGWDGQGTLLKKKPVLSIVEDGIEQA